MTTAIILAAGKSERMGKGVDKAFLSLVNKPIVAWSLIAFERCAQIDQIVLVVRKDQLVASKAVVKMFGIAKIHAIVAGGTKRSESVQAGLAACDIDTRTVVIHDAARPLVTSEMIAQIAEQSLKFSAVTLGAPVTDTLKRCEKAGTVTETVPRDKLWAVQTPQAFAFREIRNAYKQLKTDVTDDCQVAESAGMSVKILESHKANFKITTVEDLQFAAALLR